MSATIPRPAVAGAVVPLLLVLAAEASAQVCMGVPTEQGHMSLVGEVVSTDRDAGYGGRLAMNFNTEFSLDAGVRSMPYEAGTGMVVAGRIGYEMDLYRPPVCFLIGVRHERRPLSDGGDTGTTLIPIGVGVGKRLGSARGLSLALFAIPEYLVIANPAPAREFDTFWDELSARSEARGTVGMMLATPFLFATGAVELGTREPRNPAIAVGVGVTF